MKIATVLLLLAAQAVQAQIAIPDAPPLTVELTQEAAEAKAAFRWKIGGFTLSPSVRAGELAPYGRISSKLPTTMGRTPYFGAGARLETRRIVELLVMGDLSTARLNSSKGYADPGHLAGSPAADRGRSFSERVKTISVYADMGKIVELGSGVRAAFYAAVSDWTSTHADGAPNRMYGFGETALGAAALAKIGRGEVTVGGQLRLEEAPRDRWNNGHWVKVPSGSASTEYSRPIGSLDTAAGMEISSQRADLAVRPYVSLGGERVAAIIAAETRRSRDPFYPDVKGAAVRLQAAPAEGVSLMVEGRADRKSYGSAAPNTDFTVSGQVAVDLSRIMRVTAGHSARSKADRAYRTAHSEAMNRRMSEDEYRSLFDRAMRESATLEEFAGRIPAGGVDDILASIAAFTETFGDRNYNYDTDNVPNLDDMGELYRRGRASYLTGDRDGILICIGSAQFAANLARELAARAGVPLVASAVSVRVPGGHAVTAMRTPEYGIVFADWGRLTPTGTMDTKEALAVYQALQGMPAVYHSVTDGPSGRHVGYLFSDEGRAMVRRLTYHSGAEQPVLPRMFEDAPRGSDIAAARYKQLLRVPR